MDELLVAPTLTAKDLANWRLDPRLAEDQQPGERVGGLMVSFRQGPRLHLLL
ncbi:hypothetical protein ARTHRO9AX_160008 [Arthrobacter sp. 9AX]|nr:hypothetical protein ARTHRO9AX_160008 [Arthrobacter sp. 9AX]